MGSFDVTVQLPRVGRKRMTVVCTMAATAMTLWFWAAFRGLAGMRPCWQIVVGGLVIPWGWAWLMLIWAEYRILKELKRVEHRPLPEHDRAGVR